MEMIASLWPVWAGAAVFLLAWLIQTLIALRRSVDRIFADTVYEETEPVGANQWRFSRLESMNESERQTKFAQNPQMGDWYRLEVWWRQRTRTL